MPAYDGQHGGSRGSDSGSFSAVIPEDCHVSRRISLFHVAAPDGGQCCPNAVAKEESSRGSARRNAGKRRRGAQEGTGSARPAAGGLAGPVAAAASRRCAATGISKDFCPT